MRLIRSSVLCGASLFGAAVLGGTAAAQVPGTIDFVPPPPAPKGTATYSCTQPNGKTTTFTAEFYPLSLVDCDPHPGAPKVTVSCDSAGHATPTISPVRCGTVRITAAPKGSTITVNTDDHATVDIRVSDVTVVINQGTADPPDVVIQSADKVTVKFTGDGIGTLTLTHASDCHVTATGGTPSATNLNPRVGGIEVVKFTSGSKDNDVKCGGDQPDVTEDSNSHGNHVNGKKYPFEKKPKKNG